ncbi:uncharacterized protein BDR25DRAFT_130767 [Lindgomyces ingoldianus]|uniref:Uncharacterized protein n=1 Tax=Lindgomyces ingoldianus TaxID=673940 RepID=A0ACB6R2F0_9PLEO|nr:uncharacterized protein BDR25DRAFT_130767 [Lindgomyces ingoldianus]KAF2473321.1 hypothetical protein BDR25DRAFT_130767 [Lindgomyces ingoldianus]
MPNFGPTRHAGSNSSGATRKSVGLVHGAGEAIRGNLNAAVDNAANDRHGAAKNSETASRGIDEMEHGHSHGPGADVTPVDMDQELQRRAAQGKYRLHTGARSSNYGTHQSNFGRKPGADNRGTQTSSTTSSPQDSNVSNKLDPRYSSDLDHPGAQIGGSGKINSGPQSTEVGSKLDQRYDPDLDRRMSSSNCGPRSRSIGNKVDPRVDLGLDHKGASQLASGSTNNEPESINMGNELDPRVTSDLGKRLC